ncbi:MAG: hypothetical protein UT95_C0059G0006 [Candidatus Curtissbacteria bacterium GW2011_GWB1_40_28]|nr:MAG: hypothetical protein UT95_C0059G0006 [Candidatus Curtissbacteria bacterium GW2011_GWB1_40_28]
MGLMSRMKGFRLQLFQLYPSASLRMTCGRRFWKLEQAMHRTKDDGQPKCGEDH